MSLIDLFTSPHFLMMLGLLVSLSIALIAVAFHKPKQWFLIHKIFIVIALIFGVIGLILLGGLKFMLLHSILGLIGLILLAFSALGGLFATKRQEPKLRKVHIWFGRVLYIYFLIVILIGIATFL